MKLKTRSHTGRRIDRSGEIEVRPHPDPLPQEREQVPALPSPFGRGVRKSCDVLVQSAKSQELGQSETGRINPPLLGDRAGVRAVSFSRRSAFTLAEVLAALLLMAIVVPVTVEALHTANLAGEVAQRKALAARLGERILTEHIVSQQWNSVQNGNESVGPYQFTWIMRNQAWNPNTTTPAVVNGSTINAAGVHELAIDVSFIAQNKNYSVHLSTLIDTTQQQ